MLIPPQLFEFPSKSGGGLQYHQQKDQFLLEIYHLVNSDDNILENFQKELLKQYGASQSYRIQIMEHFQANDWVHDAQLHAEIQITLAILSIITVSIILQHPEPIDESMQNEVP